MRRLSKTRKAVFPQQPMPSINHRYRLTQHVSSTTSLQSPPLPLPPFPLMVSYTTLPFNISNPTVSPTSRFLSRHPPRLEASHEAPKNYRHKNSFGSYRHDTFRQVLHSENLPENSGTPRITVLQNRPNSPPTFPLL